MKKLTLWLMQYQLKKAKVSAENQENSIVKKAMEHRVKVYESAIIMLKG